MTLKTRRVLKLVLLTSAAYVLALAITAGLSVFVMVVLGNLGLLDTGCGWLFLTLLACFIAPVVVAAHAWDWLASTLLSTAHCPRCGYDLRGSSGPACPECGEATASTRSA